MALSESTDFNVNRDEIIGGALRLIGALGQGELPTAIQLEEASQALNMLVKAWSVDGLPLWITKINYIDLEDGVHEYTISDPKSLKLLQAWNRNINTYTDIPIRIVPMDEYNRLGYKIASGNPILLTHQPMLNSSTIKVYPVPTAQEQTNNKIFYQYIKPYDDLDGSTDNLEFPSEWFLAVKYGLAHVLSPEYGIDLNDRRQLLQEAMIFKNEALSFGTEEGSIKFQVANEQYQN